MSLIRPEEIDRISAIAALPDCNPFVPERVGLEQRILGSDFVPGAEVWHADGESAIGNPNLAPLHERIQSTVGELFERLSAGVPATAAELELYRNVALYSLWVQFADNWYELIDPSSPAEARDTARFYKEFLTALTRWMAPLPPPTPDPAHYFALGYQTRRAFHHIFRKIFGASPTAATLRKHVWESIFTANSTRYRDCVFQRMGRISTLITGESGTGKELVASAIARSQYIPFDANKGAFVDDRDLFLALNLSALSSSVIESELFGHGKGSFTGAVSERAGWLESCSPHGAVFLDEIGEIDEQVQVKLLRVLQTRELHRIGEQTPRAFRGKLITATNRDLRREVAKGNFREDLFHRLDGDSIRTPSLRQQLAERPADLDNLILIAARRIAGAAGDDLAIEVREVFRRRLPPDYSWPGNMRQLEHSVCSVLVHGDYQPADSEALPALPPRRDLADDVAARMRAGTITADELIGMYCRVLHSQTQSAREIATLMGISRRTVGLKLKEAKLRPDDEGE